MPECAAEAAAMLTRGQEKNSRKKWQIAKGKPSFWPLARSAKEKGGFLGLEMYLIP